MAWSQPARAFSLVALALCLSQAAALDFPFVPERIRAEGKSVGGDYSALVVVPPDSGDPNGELRSLLDSNASEELKALVFGMPDFAAADLSHFSFRPGAAGEAYDFDLPLESAWLAYGFHEQFLAFMAAYGSSNLDAEAVSRRLYVNVDEGTVAAYDRIFAFNPLQKARIAVNLIHFGRVELAQSLMEAWSPYLAPSPALATSILAAAAEAGDPGLFDACLAYFPQRDNLVLSEACVMEDFSYGFDKVFEPNGDFGPVLEAAVRMSNAAFVERILAVTQRSRLSKDRVAEVLQAAIVAGEARNRYVYLLLLSNGYDPERRYASSVLRAVLLETEAKPDQDLEAKTRFADALLRLGADINRIEPLWGPYLHWYASTDWFPFQYKTGMIKWLLARGANPMARWQGLLYDEIPLSRHGRINEEGVRLRATPDLRGTVIQRLEKGTAFEVLEMGEIELSVDYYTGLWYKIRLKGGVTGWVFGKYIDYEE